MALPPPTGVAMRAFYPALGEMELSAEFEHTTEFSRLLDFLSLMAATICGVTSCNAIAPNAHRTPSNRPCFPCTRITGHLVTATQPNATRNPTCSHGLNICRRAGGRVWREARCEGRLFL